MARTATKQTQPDAAPPRSRPKPPGGKRRPVAEMEQILSEVEALMDFGAGISQLRQALPHIPERTLKEYMARATARAVEENAERRSTRREHQLRRLYGYVRQLMQDRNDALKVKDLRTATTVDHSIARFEALISRIEGNLAPEVLKIIKNTGWEDLTEEQLDEFARTGIPPAGVNAESLLRLH